MQIEMNAYERLSELTHLRVIVGTATLSALAVALVRHGLSAESIDDMRAISMYARGEDVHEAVLHPLYNWGRWLTVLILSISSWIGVPAFVANKFSYPLYEALLALMNTLFVVSVLRRKGWEVLGFVVFLGLADTWLVLSNFAIVSVSLVSCFAITSIYISFRDHPSVQKILLPLCTIGVCSSYQGFLYVFIAIVTVTTVADSLHAGESYRSVVVRLLVAAARVVAGAAIYFAASQALYVLLDVGKPNIKFNTGNLLNTLRNNVSSSIKNALSRDWLIYPPDGTVNWRHASYGLFAVLSAGLLWRSREDRAVNLIACCLIPLAFFLVVACQPLQLFSGHGGVPYRAFAFTNYILCGAVMLNLIAFSKRTSGDGLRRFAGGFFVVVAGVMLYQTSSIAYSFELTRSRDAQIVRSLQEFYTSRRIPVDSPLAIGLSRSADDPFVAYAGAHRIDALASAMRISWSYIPFTSLNSFIQPASPTKEQREEAQRECAKYGRDGFNVQFEYHPPLVVICY